MVNCSDLGILFYYCDVNNLRRKEVIKMTREELQRIIDSEPYDFLRTDPHLGNHLMFLTIGGSHAYGTNVAGSDVDIRGVALNSKEDLLGLGEFEHHVDTATDTTVFSFNKAAKLLCSGNPNMLEQLGNADELVIDYHPTTRLLMENKNLFLSKRVIYSFGGFAGKLIKEADATWRAYLYEVEVSGGNPNVKPYIPCGEKRFNKTVMNAIRLYHMLFDILEKGEINTYRGAEHDILMQIRNSDYDYDELRNHVIPVYEARLRADKKESELPDHVNMKLVNELVMTINGESLKV
jgi:predicted nucleotidyltransferase